jgi:hypothetical protein
MEIDPVIEALNVQINALLTVRDDILALKRLDDAGLDLGEMRDAVLLKVSEKAQVALGEIGKLDLTAITKTSARAVAEDAKA